MEEMEGLDKMEVMGQKAIKVILQMILILVQKNKQTFITQDLIILLNTNFWDLEAKEEKEEIQVKEELEVGMD